MLCNAIYQSVNTITKSMIEAGLSEDQNFPSIKEYANQTKVSYSGFEDLSIALKNIDYPTIYEYFYENRQFNIRFLDGGLLQFQYTFENQELVKHRLAYFPAPNFEPFQSDPELYLDESNYYADMVDKAILPIPVRFDFDPSNYQEIAHPASHLTLGQYKNCRIPVKSAICPCTFTNFILQSFYNTAFREISTPSEIINFPLTIATSEKSGLHLHQE